MRRALAAIVLSLACGCTLILGAREEEPDGDSGADTDGDGDADADADADGDADADADADVDTDGDADGDADSDADIDGDADGDSDADLDGDVDAGCEPSEWLCGWAWRRLVSIQGVGSALSNFVVAVESEGDGITPLARTDGSDIRFTADDGTTELDREIEVCDRGSDTLVAWVRIPTLPGAGVDIYMYYGNPVPGASSPPESTWPTEVYTAVWHLTLGTEAETDVLDSTSNHIDGTLRGSVADGERGMAGRALLFDAEGDFVDFGDPEKLDFGAASFSFSLWAANDAPAGDYDTAFSNGGSRANEAGYDLELGRGSWEAHLSDGTSWAYCGFDAWSTGSPGWTHLTVVVDRAASPLPKLALYADGVARASIEVEFGAVHPVGPATLSRDSDDSFAGMIDEVRVYSEALTEPWIRAEHENLRDGSDFVTIEDPEPAP